MPRPPQTEFEIDAEFARDLQHAGAVGDFVAFARRREDDPMRTQVFSLAPAADDRLSVGSGNFGFGHVRAFQAADPFSRLREKVARSAG